MIRVSLFAALMVLLLAGCGKEARISFYVEGNCEACKPLIDETLTDARGVDSAGWDFSKSMATVVFNANRTDPDQLQQALAAKGFETQFFPANEEARKSLPECCRQRLTRKLAQ